MLKTTMGTTEEASRQIHWTQSRELLGSFVVEECDKHDLFSSSSEKDWFESFWSDLGSYEGFKYSSTEFILADYEVLESDIEVEMYPGDPDPVKGMKVRIRAGDFFTQLAEYVKGYGDFKHGEKEYVDKLFELASILDGKSLDLFWAPWIWESDALEIREISFSL